MALPCAGELPRRRTQGTHVALGTPPPVAAAFTMDPKPATCLRSAAYAGLVAVYFSVSLVAWNSAPAGEARVELDPLERAGLQLWRDHNCQACHQLHGFGGFLGPDLTNVVTDERSDREFARTLSEGVKQMPAFHFDEEQQASVLAFLRAMDFTGCAEPRPLEARRPLPATEHYRALAGLWSERTGAVLPETEARGLEVWSRQQCGACHVPFARGRFRAPDHSAAAVDRSARHVDEPTSVGRGVMPSFQLTGDDVAALSSWLEFVAAHRDEWVELECELVQRDTFSFGDLPWFEYR
ncbi:MAG: cytochrome c [Planctomycetaceae bacterium]|nr:cytochrome c [Planctomycetaceae bacterium]